MALAGPADAAERLGTMWLSLDVGHRIGMGRIMNKDQGRVCPVERAGSLDNVLRRLLQNPLKILSPYIKEGMTALDVGCGPGFFTIPMAQLVGCTGRVIAVDLQEGMLDKIRCKITGTEIEKRIVLHKCDKNSIGICERIDFVLLFYMVHELPDKDSFFAEIARIMRQTGRALIVEPPFHVSRSAFDISLDKAKTAGLTQSQGPKILLSKTAILQKCLQNAADGRGTSFSHSPHSQATRR